jgi:membrane glycosyltransferase
MLGRVMQFAQALYGPAFMAGLDYWQGGEANYWGHNAIIRLAPFIESCALPPLPGKEPFGGHILSHDFVEAALMRKAGYAVRLLRTSRGSYEEGPPTLVDMLKRDRRWCQGNMQHFWLLFAKGWHPMSRLNFFHGILSYASSVLWFLFLLLATFLAATPVEQADDKVALAEQLLLGLTITLIFLPKIVMLLDELFTGRLFKPLKLRMLTLMSCAGDTIIFTLMAPVLMIFHAQFVIYTILGKGVRWIAQRRKIDGGVDWRELFFTFGPIVLIGLIWTFIAFRVSSGFLLWISPILVSLILAMVIGAVVSSGRSGFRFGLFRIPEELEKPPEILQLESNLAEIKDRALTHPDLEKNFGLVQVFLDPYVNGLHVSLLRRRRNIHVSRDFLRELADRLIRQGPQALKKWELKSMIHDTDTVTDLHYRLWSAAEHDLAPFWSLAIKQYNLAKSSPFAHLLAQNAPPRLEATA